MQSTISDTREPSQQSRRGSVDTEISLCPSDPHTPTNKQRSSIENVLIDPDYLIAKGYLQSAGEPSLQSQQCTDLKNSSYSQELGNQTLEEQTLTFAVDENEQSITSATSLPCHQRLSHPTTKEWTLTETCEAESNVGSIALATRGRSRKNKK